MTPSPAQASPNSGIRNSSRRRVVGVAAAMLALLSLAGALALVWRPQHEAPKLSPEAMRAKQVLAMLPEGIERFLLTDINNPAASIMARSQLENVEDPEVRRTIYELAEHGLGVRNIFGAPTVAHESSTGFIDDPTKNYWPGHNTEAYDHLEENPFQSPVVHPLSTFSIDVDTASYANVRRFLREGVLPPPGAVRIEELLNYFEYDYPAPDDDAPFTLTSEVAACPWTPKHRLVRLGLRGRDLSEVPPCNLVFLIDVSGSMSPSNKLPLLREALSRLVRTFRAIDRVGIVVYAGESGLLLPSIPGHQHQRILAAIHSLGSGGSTNGAGGIQMAYDVARTAFIRDGVNRVILATDGDFNVGITDRSHLVELIQNEARSGVFLTVLGVGMGNYKDATLEELAGKGNGNYAYIDSMRGARKVLSEQMSGTFVTIANDVKIQVEFNPARVQAYRLIGYENRVLAAEDFNDDAKDAGDVGAGHRVTALYEIVPPGVHIALPDVDALAFQQPAHLRDAAGNDLAVVKIRYKDPDQMASRKLVFHIADSTKTFRRASADFQFAAAVAGYGMVLRRSSHAKDLDYARIRRMAAAGLASDSSGYRAEFLDLVDAAARLDYH